jgi:cytochrome c oxidase assembly factor CtaG
MTNDTFDAFLLSWPFDPWIVVPLVLTAVIYVRGWRRLRQRGAHRFQHRQLYAFLGGLAALLLALASPIDPFADLLLLVHMLQHLLLMMIAPPLLWLGDPLVPLLCGLPTAVRVYWVAPFLRLRPVRRLCHSLTHPAIAWLLYAAATWLWHVPPLYETALQQPAWHVVEHACFLGSALLFWWPVVQPFPSAPRWSHWALLPYLLLADLQNTVLSALLTFSEQVLYPHYAAMPRLWGFSALDDQITAGLIMWIPGSLAYLVPCMAIGSHLLWTRTRDTVTSTRDKVTRRQGDKVRQRIALPVLSTDTSVTLSPCHLVTLSASGFDLLRLPVIGRFLKWRHARLAVQIPLFLLAAIIIVDGLVGPQIAPFNLAGVLPWIHWRGLIVLVLLIAGNFFCTACPFLLPRTLARKWLPVRRAWPRLLRSKWLAVALLVLFFWAYEAFALWASPWWTAWIAVGYFVAAFAIDGWFAGAAFCKYVCPIGQFNFVQSLVSPLEIRVRDAARCLSCATKECIRGGRGIPGCELHLFQPRKAGNLDCTFCLDCVHACPHDNVGMLATAPAGQLWHDKQRSGLGRLSRRPDLAALVIVLVFAAFANAAGMVAPVVAWQDSLATALGLSSSLWVVTAFLLVATIALPLVLVGLATALGRWGSGDRSRWLETACRFSYTLVPLGFGMWLAHYSFHLFTSYDAVLPAVQRWAADLGLSLLGTPEASCCCCLAVAAWIPRLEIVFLDLGLLLSLYTAYRLALAQSPRLPQALRAFAPWGALLLLLFAVGIWIVFQPMQMRGTALLPG